ncbi:MAG: DUF3800 domain-containing protein [Candidatus Atribacteria bacterium]|nr:DUF3800 domain-containing protein [Candidatus Atribacteria bacterium]
MYFLYVDESGDPGKHPFASNYYILSGIVINQENWLTTLSRLKAFRKSLKEKYGLNQRTEIHAAELIRVNKLKEYCQIRKTDRINILKDYSLQIPVIFDTSKIINICLKKSDFQDTSDILLTAWKRLIQRFDNYLKKEAKDKGLIISDDTDSLKIMELMRKMRVYNPISSHYSSNPYNSPTDNILEDLFQRSSGHSYFIQSVDVIAHLLYRREFIKGSLRKYGLEKQFDNLLPVLLTEASKNDTMGIVRK